LVSLAKSDILAHMKTVVGCFLILVLTTVSLVAQTVHSPARKVIDLPKTALPMWDEGNDFGKTVRVAVTVDEAGNVISVGNATGPGSVCPSVTRPDVLALREKAKVVAAKAKFEPSATGATLSYVEVQFPSKPQTKSKKEGKVEGFTVATNDPPTAGSDGGVLNGKAISLPKPAYPPAARAVRAEGTVQMQVLIDEEGNLFSAAAVSGHPLLRAAARQAACGAKFTPTLLSGSPVKVFGIITYNFVP
jgi:TonB family protein